jgi:hypothetical protein
VVDSLLHTLYGIPLKWEPHSPPTVTWCESTLTFLSHGPSLVRKGVEPRGGSRPEELEWAKWVNRWSPNAQFTLKSMLPSLALKSIWYAASATDLRDNIRSMYVGLGAKGYPVAWWGPTLRRFLQKYNLTDLIPFQAVDAWVGEGRILGS